MDITEQLEAMIDKHGLTHVLTGLELVCGEKAAHIRINWQDNKLANKWAKAATKFYNLAKWADKEGKL